jgi:succinate dehydrogenase / fumarate reductase cytochrome b subunit
MAENPQKAARPRPLSPFVTIYRWPVTMATSIAHRVTGVGLALGTMVLAWWLIAIASGPEAYQSFNTVAASWIGQIGLFGFAWSLAYHFLNGIRHLAWDTGYGFDIKTADATGWLVIVLSVVLTVGAFALVYTGHGGFNT